ncbi:MAG: FtsX-like permease family protein [Myxococcota bacterium]|nr:FtsX-like permease family protein [Myxococcota bacterium]
MKLTSSSLRMLSDLAFRNLFSHWQKNLIVGSIMCFGTILVVLGTALLDSIETSMSRSIISSFGGHLQLYAKDARDDLALFGGGMMGASDIGELSRFDQIRKRLEKEPGIKAVVPMGISRASMSTGNEMDRLLETLRQHVKENQPQKVEKQAVKIRAVLDLLANELERKKLLSAAPEKISAELSRVQRAQSEEFWEQLIADPETHITFLESKIAPISPDDRLIYLKYLGTDLDRFAKSFDRFEIVRGTMVPSGERGFLINQKVYDKWLKNKIARELDEIKNEMEEEGSTIAEDAKLTARVRRMSRLYRVVTYQLDPDDSDALKLKLQKFLGKEQGDINELFQSFLTVDDKNFSARYGFFYKEVAPLIKLYRVAIGEYLNTRSYTKSGYVKSVRTKVYGTFRFKGLEASDLAGQTSLVDLMTFRELYGAISDETRDEVKAIQKEIGIDDVSRSSAEDALFGESMDLEEVVETDDSEVDSDIEIKFNASLRESNESTKFTQDDIDQGLALNAAVLLENPSSLERMLKRVAEIEEEDNLGVQAVSWRKASGIVGQFIVLVRVVLYVIISITFLVALVIINNSMIMATMERVKEIGTIRAIGAQRKFVLLMFLMETMALGIVSGLIGAGIGAGIIKALGSVGLPATSKQMVFLFSGPRLFPTVEPHHLIFASVVILLVSIISTLYPALIATRVEPVVAMQAGE